MNDLDKKDLLELTQTIITAVHTIGSVKIKNDRINKTSRETVIEALNEIKDCAYTIVEIVKINPIRSKECFN
jgi:hypothetical protein